MYFAMNLIIVLGMFVSVSLCMFTISNALLMSYSYSAFWRPGIVETFCNLVAYVVQNSVCRVFFESMLIRNRWNVFYYVW